MTWLLAPLLAGGVSTLGAPGGRALGVAAPGGGPPWNHWTVRRT